MTISRSEFAVFGFGLKVTSYSFAVARSFKDIRYGMLRDLDLAGEAAVILRGDDLTFKSLFGLFIRLA